MRFDSNTRQMAPTLNFISWIAVAAGIGCAAVVAVHAWRHPQHMWIMDIVWPVTALYSGPLGLAAYWRFGRLSTREAFAAARRRQSEPPSQRKSLTAMTAVAATHCGAGCTLGDLVAEWFVVAVPISLFGHHVFGTWALDFALAFVLGVAFQYLTIAPMRHLGPRDGLVAALKADALSLTAWQLGMYGWMAIVIFGIFGHELPKTSPVFWFMMQIAMLAGFATAYPVNWWLLRAGLKEKM
jgi:hypothetical protein